MRQIGHDHALQANVAEGQSEEAPHEEWPESDGWGDDAVHTEADDYDGWRGRLAAAAK